MRVAECASCALRLVLHIKSVCVEGEIAIILRLERSFVEG